MKRVSIKIFWCLNSRETESKAGAVHIKAEL